MVDKDTKIIGLTDEIGLKSFQGYRHPITNVRPIKLITLHEFLLFTQEATSFLQEVFFQISQAEKNGDVKLKSELKQKYLYYFTPCVIVGLARQYRYIICFTGLLVLDFDHIDNAQDFKYFLFNEYKCIVAVWLSPSKRGVKCLVKIPIVQTVEEFKEYFFGIAEEMEVYNGFDPSGQNCVLPLFQSYDPELLDRSDADTWTIKGIKRGNFDAGPVSQVPNIDVTDRDKQSVIKIINTGFDHITDYGHPPLRSLCLTIGGYIAAGYIDEPDALRLINHKIENHIYLSKGITGYQKTAQWAITQGQRKPLVLNQ